MSSIYMIGRGALPRRYLSRIKIQYRYSASESSPVFSVNPPAY
jgi:hypothetical protein